MGSEIPIKMPEAKKPKWGFETLRANLALYFETTCRRCIFKKNHDIFKIVKQSLTTRQAAEAYGFPPNRSGMICCPFHADRNPSMKVDARFHCFGCGADGDVIDFTAKLFQLSLRQAVEKLVTDFGLSSNNGEQSCLVQKIKTAEFHQRKDMIQTLYECRSLLENWRIQFAPKSPEEPLHPCFVTSLHQINYIYYLIENRKDFINHRKEVQQIVQRIQKLQTDYLRNPQNALAS